MAGSRSANPRPPSKAGRVTDGTALLVVDVQRGFCSGGNLAVPDGDAVVPVVNRVARAFSEVVLTQDWHPADHLSFASQHPGRAAFDSVAMPYGLQTLWPDHCVMGTEDAAFHPALDIPHAGLVIRKGRRREVDSYSAFLEADRRTPTGLRGWLAERGIGRVVILGLATDYCVTWTALDARAAGLEAVVVEDGCRGIDLGGSVARAWAGMEAAGVRRARAVDFA